MQLDSHKFAIRIMIVSCLLLVALVVFSSGMASAQESQVFGLKNPPAFTNTPRQVREGSAPLTQGWDSIPSDPFLDLPHPFWEP